MTLARLVLAYALTSLALALFLPPTNQLHRQPELLKQPAQPWELAHK